VTSINDLGQRVGTYRDSGGAAHGYFFDGSNYVTLDDPFAAQGTQPFATQGTQATGVNNAGQVVGYYTDTSGKEHGFLYSNGTFRTLDFGTRPFTEAHGINNLGQIVGTYANVNDNRLHSFLLSISEVTWTAGVSGDFATASNWNTGVVPGAGDDITLGGSGTYSVTSTANETVDSIVTASGVTLGIFAGSFPLGGTLGSTNTGTIIVGSGANFVVNGSLLNAGAVEGLGGHLLGGTGTVGVGQGGAIDATGNNFLFHGLGGSETIRGTGNLNSAFSDSGNALIAFSGNQNHLYGGSATDWLGISGNSNAINGGAGNDFLGATGTGNTLAAGTGNQALFANSDGNVLYAGSGQDWLGTSGNQDQIFGGPSADWMGVTGTHNAIAGGSGNSTLFGVGSSNTLSGGSGNDFLGVSGNNNYLAGGSGNCYIAATGSGNTLDPHGAGTDTLFAAPSAHDHDQFVYHPGYGNVTINNLRRRSATSSILEASAYSTCNSLRLM
jgi:probable HAF family extracellular repeat protein